MTEPQASSPIDTLQKKSELKVRPDLFKTVVYRIVRDDLIVNEYDILDRLLKDGGAKELDTVTEGNREVWDVKKATHIIATNIDFPEYPLAEEFMINVVKPLWVYKSVSHNRLSPLRMYSPDPSFFFSDLNITIASNIPDGDRLALYGGVRAMGGQWSEALTRFTTHIIALNLDDGMCEASARIKRNIKIVLPHWIDDCLKLHRRIDDSPYLLPDPKFLTSDEDRKAALEKIHHAYIYSGQVSENLNPPEVRSNIFGGKAFYLHAQLNLSERSLATVQYMIKAAGGECVNVLTHADVLVTRYRDGDDYIQACKTGLVVGNLTWLYWMVAHDRWASPLNRLLHYPVPREGLEEMKNYKLCISGYSGDSRHYLEDLIGACGAKYSKALTRANTHLITARPSGEKYVSARDWNLHVVNHLWLEETYSKCTVQTVSLQRYSHFPRMTNMMDVIGQTRLDPHELRRFYDPVPESGQDGVFEQHDDSGSETFASANETQPPASPKVAEQERKLALISQNSIGAKSVESESQKDEDTKAVSRTSKENAVTVKRVSKGKSGSTVEPVQKDGFASSVGNASPIALAEINGGRRAKEKAATKLKSDIDDLNVFEVQKKRKGLPRLPMEEESQAGVVLNKRKSDEPKDIEGPSQKKKAKAGHADISMKVIITGYRALSLSEIHKLQRLGIEVVDKPDDITHLASPKISRTERFLCAIPRAPTVISTKFIEDCLSKGDLLNDQDYILVDRDGEKNNKFVLKKTLQVARSRGAGPFENMVINVTAKAIKDGGTKGLDTLANIITANGGVCEKARAPKTKYGSSPDHPLVLVSSMDDEKFFSSFRKYAEKEGREYYILSHEWIATGVLRMKVKFDNEFALVDQ